MRDFQKRILTIAVYCATLILSGCASGIDVLSDCYSLAQFKKLTSPSFDPYFMNVKSGDKSRVDIYIQMPYTHLRFEKTLDGFRASYECTFIIKDEEQQIVQTKEVERMLEPKTYEETISQRFDFFLQSFVLEPGWYSIEIVSIDNLSQLRYRYGGEIEAQNFQSPRLNASNELFLDTIVVDDKGITLRPILPSSISLLDNSLGIFQELYNVKPGDTITISESYAVPKRIVDTDKRNYYPSPPYRMNEYRCTNEYDSTYLKKDSVFIASGDSIVQLFQFYPLPSFGNTSVTRKIIRKSSIDTDTLSTRTMLFRRDAKFWMIPSLEEIIGVMRYILSPEEYDSIAHASGMEKKKRINEFWETHGSYQGKSDFERRVKEADLLFTSCIEGSKTPMGIVYVVCGAPDFVDCRGSFLTESWYYTIGERTYPIQFRQVNTKSGLLYYEIIPFTMNESLWQYFVDRWRNK